MSLFTLWQKTINYFENYHIIIGNRKYKIRKIRPVLIIKILLFFSKYYIIVTYNISWKDLFLLNNTLTEENLKKLQEELEYRLTVKRGEIAREKLEAAAHGDRSENAEYKEACRNYRENDNRIQYLLTMISTATVIDDKNVDKSVLGINSKFRIKFIEDDFEDIITLVTTLDSSPVDMLISIESDLGKSLHGKKVGDQGQDRSEGQSGRLNGYSPLYQNRRAG